MTDIQNVPNLPQEPSVELLVLQSLKQSCLFALCILFTAPVVPPRCSQHQRVFHPFV